MEYPRLRLFRGRAALSKRLDVRPSSKAQLQRRALWDLCGMLPRATY